MAFSGPRPALKRVTATWLSGLEAHARALRCRNVLIGLRNAADRAQGWPPAPSASGYRPEFATRFWAKQLYHLAMVVTALLRRITADVHDQPGHRGCSARQLNEHLSMLRQLLAQGGVVCADTRSRSFTPYSLAMRVRVLCGTPESDRPMKLEQLIGRNALPATLDPGLRDAIVQLLRQLACSVARSLRSILSGVHWKNEAVTERYAVLLEIGFLFGDLKV